MTGIPPIGSNALFRPIRLDRPPARITAVIAILQPPQSKNWQNKKKLVCIPFQVYVTLRT
ncbi:hypothetical protein D1872_274600 [compost metagenome]